MRLLAAAVPLFATTTAAAAAAGPIVVLGPAAPAVTAEPRCAATPGPTGADLECVVTLPVATEGAGSAPPSRILIRTIFTPARCAASQAQVVQMTPEPTLRGLPVVEHAPSREGCPS